MMNQLHSRMKKLSITLRSYCLVRQFGKGNAPNISPSIITVKVSNEPYKGDYLYAGYDTRPPTSGSSVVETTFKGKTDLLDQKKVQFVDSNVYEEALMLADEISGSKKHPQSQYDSSHPNEKSDPHIAYYDPKLYNIEEMDYILGSEEKNIEESNKNSSPQNSGNKYETAKSIPNQRKSDDGERNRLFRYKEPSQLQHNDKGQSSRSFEP